MTTWAEHRERELARYRDGEERLPGIDDPDARQKQLTRMGNAAGGVGLTLLMAGATDEAGEWFARAAERYRESWPDAPPGSWGRLIGAVKSRLLGGDWEGAERDAAWALEQQPGESESPIGRYAACLAELVLGRDHEARHLASSIRERIYAIPGVGYGVLLYTGTSDSEGTLGGLIQVDRRIHDHIRNALELGELCSNDPVCAQHMPDNRHERRYIHGAACHGCLLIAETSCEQQNDYLDRSLVVLTVENLGIEFFRIEP